MAPERCTRVWQSVLRRAETSGATSGWQATLPTRLITAGIQVLKLNEFVPCQPGGQVEYSTQAAAVCNALGCGGDRSVAPLTHEGGSMPVASASAYMNKDVDVFSSAGRVDETHGAIQRSFGHCKKNKCAKTFWVSIPSIRSTNPAHDIKMNKRPKLKFVVQFYKFTSIDDDEPSLKTSFCAVPERGSAETVIYLLRPSTSELSPDHPEQSLLQRWAATFEAGRFLEEEWNRVPGDVRVCFIPDLSVKDAHGGDALLKSTISKLNSLIQNRSVVYGGTAVRNCMELMERQNPREVIANAFTSEKGRLMLYSIIVACTDINLVSADEPQSGRLVSSGACRRI